jgi:hypothetical protein
VPPGLISGCFKGVPEKLFCEGRVKHSDLNKDGGRIDPNSGAIGAAQSKRGQVRGNFARAVRAVISDTRAKWRYFERRVVLVYGPARGRKIICAMRRDDPDGC